MRFPSSEFEDAVAALCHGTASDEQLTAVYDLLRSDGRARDEYLWQVELHAWLLSDAVKQFKPRGMDSAALLGCMKPTSPAESARLRQALMASSVALLLIMLSAAVTYYLTTGGPPSRQGRTISEHRGTGDIEDRTSSKPRDEPLPQPGSRGHLAGITRPNVRFAFAADAPVIVGTGRQEPIRLGAYIPFEKGGDTLHVWDWSRSPVSRVLKDVRLWEHQRFAVSPDGTLVVWSNGDILDLRTGERSTIDLGGAYHFQIGSEMLRRIRDLQFSPDGTRLALLVSHIDVQRSAHPLRSGELVKSEVIQIVSFPGGKLLSAFPAGDTASLRIGFSADGARIVSKIPPGELRQQIVEREAASGDIVREYEPHVAGHAYAIAVSPDGSRIAAYDGVGAVLVWNTASGELMQRIGDARHESYSTVLRFSPDGQYLALNSVRHVLVIDVTTGEIAARVPQRNADVVRWSPDGEALTVVRGHAYGDGNGWAPLYNIYPSVHEWKWRTATLLRSITSEPPHGKN